MWVTPSFLAAPRAPVRRPVGRLLARPVQDPSLHLGCQHRHGPSLVPDVEPGQPLRNEPFLPLADERLRAIDPTRDLPVGHPLGQQEQDTGDPSIIGSPCPTPRTPLKLGSFLLRQSDRIVLMPSNLILNSYLLQSTSGL